MADGKARATGRRRPRWLDRRRLYSGGALMVLAPIGLGGCEAGDDGKDVLLIVPADVAGELPDGWHEAIAIAPWDPGPADLPPDVIAIAPWDPGPSDPGPDASPPAPGGYLAPCLVDADCGQEYFCQNNVICIIPTPGCGMPACEPRPCASQDTCPAGSTCLPYDLSRAGAGPRTCVRDVASPPAEGTLGGRCLAGGECVSDQHFCVDACALSGAMCIVSVETCVPLACDRAEPDCPAGAECRDVGILDACVKK